MHDDDGLFADPRPAQAQPTAPDPNPDAVPDWLIANVRKLLDEMGVETMAERQALVVELAGRPLDSLRELTPVEARQVSEKLSARRRTRPSTSSSWDDRDGDTWIDRM